jgi:hypothetical protein
MFAEKYGLDRLAGRAGHEPGPDVINRLDCDIETVDELPFEDEYFDVITMLAVFEHIEPQRLVRLVAEHKDAYSHAKISAILQRGGFSSDRIRLGYFELFLNVWATARK